MLAICATDTPVVFKAPKPSSNAEKVPQGTNPGAKRGHKKHSTSKQSSMSCKEAIKGGSSKAPTGSKTGHSKKRKESSSAMDSNLIQPPASTYLDTGMHKEDHQATGTNPHVLTKQTKSVSEGLETVLTQPITRKEASSVASQIKEENSSTIKLKDLVKLFTKSKLPCLLKVQELTNQLLILQSQEYKLKLEKNKAEDALLKAQPSFPNVEQLKELLSYMMNSDKFFTYKKGEDATEYYLRFSQLLNDRSSTRSNGAYKVNTKFLNTLPDEWSKFVPTEFK
ncbi:hypothetical protein Tco_0537667 [Tanacetum coccineum]